MIIHNNVRIEGDFISIFEAKQKIVIEALCPSFFQKPGLIMALPSHVEETIIGKDERSRDAGHAFSLKQMLCQRIIRPNLVFIREDV